jgi:chaperone BCS1
MIETLFLFASQHPYLSGGVGAYVFWTFFSSYIRDIPDFFVSKAKSHIFVSVTISQKDDSYEWVRDWLYKIPYGREVKNMELETEYPKPDDVSASVERLLRKAKNKKELKLLPAAGKHYFKYNGKRIWLQFESPRAAKEGGGGGEDSGSSSSEPAGGSFTLSMLGRSQDNIRQILHEIQGSQTEMISNGVSIYMSKYDSWKLVKEIEPRGFETIALPQGQIDDVRLDIEKFKSGKQVYKDLNIPYRRGYLLHGIAGTGKTSVITAIASELELNLCILNLASIWSDENLYQIFANTPPNSLILIEDIDASFIKRKRTKDKISVTFSGLLNAIDGIMCSDGLIVAMTTNHIELLDAALVRTGRMDYVLEFTYATNGQIGLMFERFFPNDSDRTEDFVNAFEGKRIATSDVQSLLMMSNFSIDLAIEKAKKFQERDDDTASDILKLLEEQDKTEDNIL